MRVDALERLDHELDSNACRDYRQAWLLACTELERPNVAVERRGDLFGAPFSNRLVRLGLAFATHDYPKTQAILLEVLEHRIKDSQAIARLLYVFTTKSGSLGDRLFQFRGQPSVE